LLGLRQPEIYGSTTFDELNQKLRSLASQLGIEITIFQSNHEGALIDKIQEVIAGEPDGILINPGAYGHTSIALRDALAVVQKPIVEVHISNIYRREEFRHSSYVSEIANAVIVGLGIESYLCGLRGLAYLLAEG
jgi:3-dehydroquinate dehydratase II